jgi:hypothetical protein
MSHGLMGTNPLGHDHICDVHTPHEIGRVLPESDVHNTLATPGLGLKLILSQLISPV